VPFTAAVAVVAIVAGLVLSGRSSYLDADFDALWPGDVSVATDVLALLAGSALTVLSLTVSLTVVALQMASQQFSPRLLRTFVEEREVRTVVAVLVGLFVYSLTVLRGIDQDDPSPPQFALLVALLLALAAVAALVWYIAFIVRLLRVDVMMQTAAATSARSHQALERHTHLHVHRPEPPDDAVPLLAHESGFVTMVDVDQAGDWAREHSATVVVDVRPGDHVLEGEPMGFVWGGTDTCPQCVQIANERTPHQDVALGLRQLTDIAIKALSPAVNDPTTATHAVTHASQVLVDVAERPLAPIVLTDGGRTALWAATHSTVELLDGVTAQIRRYGAGEPAILCALLHLLHGVGHRSGDPAVRAWIGEEVDRIVAAAERHVEDRYDVDKVRSAALRPQHYSGA
jgi:uncharacterized membrane protein